MINYEIKPGDIVEFTTDARDVNGNSNYSGTGEVLAYDFEPHYFYVKTLSGNPMFPADEYISVPYSLVWQNAGDTVVIIKSGDTE